MTQYISCQGGGPAMGLHCPVTKFHCLVMGEETGIRDGDTRILGQVAGRFVPLIEG